jgi:hypothetical protein
VNVQVTPEHTEVKRRQYMAVIIKDREYWTFKTMEDLDIPAQIQYGVHTNC